MFKRTRRTEQDFAEEIASHLDLEADDLQAVGHSQAEASRRARVSFNNPTLTLERFRIRNRIQWLDNLVRDIHFALRQLRRSPGFTITAILTLGLGVGATTAIFSAVYSLLLHPLPYKESSRLATVISVWPKATSDAIISPDFVAAQNETKSFEQFAGYSIGDDNLTGVGDPLKVTRAGVTANFFTILGVIPQLGRTFLTGEDRTGRSAVILLSDRLWRNKFHADSTIIGKAAILNGKEQTIVGVLPPHFSFPDFAAEPDYYAPMPLEADTNVSISKPTWPMHVVARLRSGVSIERAQAEIDAFFQARAKSYPAAMSTFSDGRRMIVESLQDHIVGNQRKPLYILLVSVLAVLLIACANVANLQLARAISRQHEIALRGALGASRARLIRQFLVESLVLSTLAAAFGFLIALAVTSAVRHAGTLNSAQAPSRTAQLLRLPFGKLSTVIQVDGWVLAFTVGLALVTTLLFGLAPAISGTRTDLRNALQLAALRITSGREQRLLRHTLLIVEIGLTVVLLASAGLLVRSFVNVLNYDSGFDSGNTLIGNTLIGGPSPEAYGRHIRSFVDQLLPRLHGLPGVETATIASAMPLESTMVNNAIAFEGVPLPPIGTWPTMSMISVTPEYFHVVSTTILQGRSFKDADRNGAPFVTIVNHAFANRFFAGDALGKRFKSNFSGTTAFDFRTFTIVGVADDVKHGGLETKVKPEAFLPMDQFPQGKISIAIRTRNDAGSFANALRQAVTTVDSNQPVFDIQTMDQRVSDATAQRRLIMLLTVCFALLAVVLSAVGVYGVFAYSVNQRKQEMGIRLALGASRSGLLRLVVMQAARLITMGGILGVGAALILNKLLASQLIGVTSHDVISFSLAWALMTLVALFASTIPAAQAARTDLVSVLHSE